eukprot:9476393-Pyramimonas_sp.AAC.1
MGELDCRARRRLNGKVVLMVNSTGSVSRKSTPSPRGEKWEKVDGRLENLTSGEKRGRVSLRCCVHPCRRRVRGPGPPAARRGVLTPPAAHPPVRAGCTTTLPLPPLPAQEDSKNQNQTGDVSSPSRVRGGRFVRFPPDQAARALSPAVHRIETEDDAVHRIVFDIGPAAVSASSPAASRPARRNRRRSLAPRKRSDGQRRPRLRSDGRGCDGYITRVERGVEFRDASPFRTRDILDTRGYDPTDSVALGYDPTDSVALGYDPMSCTPRVCCGMGLRGVESTLAVIGTRGP